MSTNRWSSSSDDSGWHPAPTNFPDVPVAKPEEIQIVLLGAPGTGKTRLQSRYTLRQFVDIESEHAHRMGGHKHLHLLDGTVVHLIIHELRTGRGRATADSVMRDDSYHEDCQRKRLLEQSDAVMLVFNPWAKDTYEWINGKIIEDILYTGKKKQLTSDIVRLLDSLAAAMPQRSKSTRSALSFSSFAKRLPRRPDEPEDSDSEVSLFSNGDEKRDEDDRIDYRGELKRISIVVEGSALKKAEFMIHEKDLPTPPPQSPTPSPLVISSPTTPKNRKLPTIREVEEVSKKAKRVAVMMDRKHLPIMKHDSTISVQSVSSRSSTYSQTETAVETERGSASGDAHPAIRQTDIISDTIVEELEEQSHLSDHTTTRTPNEETEVPVLVVATMTDRLKDNGGNLDRQVTADQGQRLARKFGPNCAYIETSAKSNSNVDEAYGIIVDQVMAKRAVQRRDELARARIEAAIQAVQAETRPTTRMKTRARSCVPHWGWLDGLVTRIPSWEAVTEKVSSVLFTKRMAGESADDSTVEVEEDVWGEKVEVKSPRRSHHPDGTARHSKRQSKTQGQPEEQLMMERTGSALGSRAGSALGTQTMSHDAAQAMPLNAIDEMTGSGQDEAIQQARQMLPVLPDKTYNPFTKEEFQRPMHMVTVTSLVPPASTQEQGKDPRRRTEVLSALGHKSSLKALRAKGSIIEGSFSGLSRKASQMHKGSSLSLRRAASRQKHNKPDLVIDTTPTKSNTTMADTDTDQKQSTTLTPYSLAQLPDLIRRKSSRFQKTEDALQPSSPHHHHHRRHRDDEPRKSNIGEAAPALPPLEFDAIVIDDKRASVSVLVRPADQEPNEEQVATFLSQDMSRDSFVMMLSPTTATRTLSAFVKEINSARASGVANVVAPPAVVERTERTKKTTRRVSEGVPEVPHLPGVESDEEKERRRTVGVIPVIPEIPRVTTASPAPSSPRYFVSDADACAPPAAIPKMAPSPPPMPDRTMTPPLPPVPDRIAVLGPLPATLTAASKKEMASPIITTTEVRGSDSSEEDQPQERPQEEEEKRLQTRSRQPPNPRRAKPKPTKNTWVKPPQKSQKLPQAPPPRMPTPQRPDSRPLSAWI